MTDAQIEEGNLIILKYLQEHENPKAIQYWSNIGQSAPLYFDESYSWLMPAVEIIEIDPECIIFYISSVCVHIRVSKIIKEETIILLDKFYTYSDKHPKKERIWLAAIEVILAIRDGIVKDGNDNTIESGSNESDN